MIIVIYVHTTMILLLFLLLFLTVVPPAVHTKAGKKISFPLTGLAVIAVAIQITRL